MKPVYQEIINTRNGDCMRACVASLLEVPNNSLFNYSESDQWFSKIWADMLKHGYEHHKEIFNKNYNRIENPVHSCWNPEKFNMSMIMTPKKLYKHEGIGGLFLGTVYSPGHFTWENRVCHAVIIDKDYNIVHDPNPNNKTVRQYPLAPLLGYNGVVLVDIFNPK